MEVVVCLCCGLVLVIHHCWSKHLVFFRSSERAISIVFVMSMFKVSYITYPR
jgi:hypothetical protein